MAILEARGLVKRFGPVTAVDHVSFEVGEGQVIGLLGPNGAGKTTTLHMLLGLVTPDGGSVRLFGEDLAHNRLRALSQVNFAAGYVHLPGALTVEESLIVFARMYAVRRPRQRVNQLVELLDLGELRKRRIRHLSSGQQTRVQIAKALVNEPVLLVLDEPTASLDPDAGDRVRQLLLPLAGSSRPAPPPSWPRPTASTTSKPSSCGWREDEHGGPPALRARRGDLAARLATGTAPAGDGGGAARLLRAAPQRAEDARDRLLANRRAADLGLPVGVPPGPPGSRGGRRAARRGAAVAGAVPLPVRGVHGVPRGHLEPEPAERVRRAADRGGVPHRGGRLRSAEADRQRRADGQRRPDPVRLRAVQPRAGPGAVHGAAAVDGLGAGDRDHRGDPALRAIG